VQFGNQLKSATVIDFDKFQMSLEFSDGKKYTVSLEDYFNPPKGLGKEIVVGQMFDQFFVSPSGALAWPNGIEFCPDLLREISEKQNGEAA
jgi:hypothetical protein